MAATFEDIEVLYTPMRHDIANEWTTFGHSKTVLPRGWVKDEGRRPLPVDMIYEKDIPITLRDGVKIYVDVFRPVESDDSPVPAILPWSIFGKTGSGTTVFDSLNQTR